MTISLSVCGVMLDASTIAGAIRSAALGAPQRDIHALEVTPLAWFGELWSQASPHQDALGGIIEAALLELLRADDAGQRGFALEALALAPTLLDASDRALLTAQLADHRALPPAALRALAALCARLVLSGDWAMDAALRGLALDPASDGALLEACWVRDHDWALAQLGALLPDDPADAARSFGIGLHHLRASERAQTTHELEGLGEVLGQARQAAILARRRRFASDAADVRPPRWGSRGA